MADYTSRTVTVTRREYVLASPTNWTQTRLVLDVIEGELKALAERKGRPYRAWDDLVTVEARDDAVVFSYEAEAMVQS